MKNNIELLPGDYIGEPYTKEDRKKILLKYLENLQKEYESGREVPVIEVPESLGLQDLEVPEVDEDAIRAQAEEELSSDYADNVTKIKNNGADTEKKLTEELENTKIGSEEAAKNIENYYDKQKDAVGKNAIDRGLARSSIPLAAKEELESRKKSELDSTGAQYDLEISRLNTEISLNEERMAEALNNYEIKYAVQLRDRIGKLTEAVEKQRQKAIAYNNKNAEKEAAYELKRDEYLRKKLEEQAEAEKQQEEYEAKYGYSGEKKENYLKRYTAVKGYLSKLSPKEALSELQNEPSLREYLGYYYNILKNELLNGSL